MAPGRERVSLPWNGRDGRDGKRRDGARRPPGFLDDRVVETGAVGLRVPGILIRAPAAVSPEFS
jgi:hypothetical protein